MRPFKFPEHDYYATLGVSKDASAAAIKSAYRKLARQLHPDVNSSPGAEEQFKLAAEAYEVLGDADKRLQYDRYCPDLILTTIFGGASAGSKGGYDGGYRIWKSRGESPQLPPDIPREERPAIPPDELAEALRLEDLWKTLTPATSREETVRYYRQHFTLSPEQAKKAGVKDSGNRRLSSNGMRLWTRGCFTPFRDNGSHCGDYDDYFIEAEPNEYFFRGLDLEQFDLRNADLRNHKLWYVPFSSSDLRGIKVDGSDLGGSNFCGCDCEGVDFSVAKSLTEASFLDANIKGANFSGTNLRHSKLMGCDVTGCRFDGTDFKEANLDGICGYTVDQFKNAKNLHLAKHLPEALKPLALPQLDADLSEKAQDMLFYLQTHAMRVEKVDRIVRSEKGAKVTIPTYLIKCRPVSGTKSSPANHMDWELGMINTNIGGLMAQRKELRGEAYKEDMNLVGLNYESDNKDADVLRLTLVPDPSSSCVKRALPDKKLPAVARNLRRTLAAGLDAMVAARSLSDGTTASPVRSTAINPEKVAASRSTDLAP